MDTGLIFPDRMYGLWSDERLYLLLLIGLELLA